MIIQCPECKSRYRIKPLPEDRSSAPVKCPKCDHRFVVDKDGAKTTIDSKNIPTILMVDDARFFRDLMVDLLKDRNAKLETADSAGEAWKILQRQKVDLLIVDINLPDKNGLDLIREIRVEKKLENLIILCISGVYRKDDDAVNAIRAGANDFISKSFKPEELNQRIDKLLK